jgi:flagellar basal body-associated protein FliL
MSESKEAPKEAKPKESGGPSKLPILLALVNTICILGVIGLAVYTKLIFKRPKITEKAERARIEAIAAKPLPPAKTGIVEFKQMTVNIAPSGGPGGPGEPAAGTSRTKSHYVTLGFVLEIRDEGRKADIEELRPRIMDKILQILGRKQVSDLSTVQGRYLLRSQILDVTNELLRAANPSKVTFESIATHVYFTQFIVQ